TWVLCLWHFCQMEATSVCAVRIIRSLKFVRHSPHSKRKGNGVDKGEWLRGMGEGNGFRPVNCKGRPLRRRSRRSGLGVSVLVMEQSEFPSVPFQLASR